MSDHRFAEQRLDKLLDASGEPIASRSRIGLEKESLRVTEDGDIAQTPHPIALGSALTNRYITMDFSEALLEFITPPCASPSEALAFMCDIHRFVYANLDDELLWATSMPCKVSGDSSVPIAQFGRSNVGTMKHVYRRGLSHRYGRVMQAIAGVHFNYSLPESIWPAFQKLVGDSAPLRDFVSDRYFALIRNFQRMGWLIPYLFGSSPAICKSFLSGKRVALEEFDRGTWYLPYATTLRMSDIGYKNKTQAGLRVRYDGVDTYVDSLTRAIETPSPEYEAIGVVVDGEYRQLNANVLQIENEYYSFIRPKRITRSGEKPTLALAERGVEYVEVRALDVSAFDPNGFNEMELRFLEAFLILCLMTESDPIGPEEQADIDFNQEAVAVRGRQPGLELKRAGRAVVLSDWAGDICASLSGVCALLDTGCDDAPYTRALELQREAIADPERLPSARMLAEMRERNESCFQFAMRLSRAHRDYFVGARLGEAKRERFETEASRSLAAQRDIEAADAIGFAEYLECYFSQTLPERRKLTA